MADTKISALTSATAPLAGTEVAPIVQSSTTKKATVEQIATATDTLRVNVTPTAETPTATHTAVFNINGTNYKFLCLVA
jgi:hypothetical protein